MKTYLMKIRIPLAKLQKKCLLSYTKTRDSTIIQKFPLPRVLLHGQTDTVEAEETRFFMETIDKSIRDALSSRNEAFIDAFHNAMKDAIHGILVSQVGSTCYNIPDPLTQGTNQVGTSHQEAAPAGNGDVQALQGSSEQTPGTPRVRYSTILDRQYNMCNSRRGKVRTR